MAKQIVIAGLKCPPETGAQVMIAKEMPIAKANPTWSMLLKNGTGSGEVGEALTVNCAIAAIPGKT
jgi:hypothetical protein